MPRVESHHGAYIIHGRDYGPEGMLVQTDYDYPGVAGSLGWSLRRVQVDRSGRFIHHLKKSPPRGKGCDHRGTDGTIKCPDCGIPASDFISAAGGFLDSIAT